MQGRPSVLPCSNMTNDTLWVIVPNWSNFHNSNPPCLSDILSVLGYTTSFHSIAHIQSGHITSTPATSIMYTLTHSISRRNVLISMAGGNWSKSDKIFQDMLNLTTSAFIHDLNESFQILLVNSGLHCTGAKLSKHYLHCHAMLCMYICPYKVHDIVLTVHSVY